MTVVAARPGLICSDSRVTGDTIGQAPKIHQIHGYFVGFAGDMCAWQRLAQCAVWPKQPTLRTLVRFVNRYIENIVTGDEDGGCDMLVCTAKAVFEIDGGSVTPTPVGVVGSGARVARGYLHARPTDVEGAVRAAIELDPSCGGPVRVVRVKK